MADRYFVETPIVDNTAVLSGAEAHHLLHVMRAGPGSQVTLFDGSGSEFAACVERCGRSEVELRVQSGAAVDRELPLRITLGVALPKGDRQRWLVEKAVELGVSRLVPLETRRGVAQPAGEVRDRLRRAVVEASKQCGRNRLMQIEPGQNLQSYSEQTAAASVRWIAHPGGTPICAALQAAHDVLRRPNIPPAPADAALAVGPEGGFAADELELAGAHGWQQVDLGRRILRIETTALLLVAALATRVD